MSGMIESFKSDIAEITWRELKIHLQRDSIITVAAEIDIIAVAVAVADDDSSKVEGWIAAEQIGKPTEVQLEDWQRDQNVTFRMLIVQPYILIQEVGDAR
ncbi:MAG: DUF2288 family protein [Desulfuromonadales bacterium]|nr:DUF2288 family protein [Desulfuromonadales bacterium]